MIQSKTMQPQIHVQQSLEDLWKDFTVWFTAQVNETLLKQDFFHLAIPGGATPETLFAYLAGPAGDGIPWEQIHFWWTDERVVPPTDARSNYRMASRALLMPRRIAEEQIHRVRAEVDPRRAAVLYAIELEDTLCRRFTSIPFFDMVVLGIGEDGHIASLFPHAVVEEPHPWSIIARHDELMRISLPYEVIGASSRIAFLVTGTRKRDVIQRVFQPQNGEDEDLPASILYRRRPDVVWFMDRSAGFSLESK